MTLRTLIIALLLLLVPATGLAQEKGKAKMPNTDMSVSPFVFRKLSKAQELMQDNKFDKALNEIKDLRNDKFLNQHEKALVWQTMGFIYASKEQYMKAANAFETALALNALAPGAALNTQFILAQLYLVADKVDKAIQVLEDWFKKAENPRPQAYYTLAVAYAQKEQWNKALRNVQIAIQKNPNPPEGWLSLLLAIHYYQENYPGMAGALERLVSKYPKKSYWLQLYAVYAEVGKKERAMAVLELSYIQGFLTDSQVQNLARGLNVKGVPFEAGTIVAHEMKAGLVKKDLQELRLLAQSWIRAKEIDRAAPVLAQAGKKSKDGGLYMQLAQMRFQQGDWDGCVKAANQALKKGMKNQGNVHFLIGIAHYNAKRPGKAEAAFRQAQKFKRNKEMATGWLLVIQADRDRRQRLIAAQKALEETAERIMENPR